MGFDSSIRRKIKLAAKEEADKLREREIFTSSELKTYLDNLAISMTEDDKCAPTVTLYDGGPDAGVACTDGARVEINVGSSIVGYFPTTEQRFVAITGLFFHELGHSKFLDFNEALRAHTIIGNGNFYGARPSGLSAKEEADWVDMETAMANPAARVIFQNVFHELSNIVSDTHDEEAMIDAYGAFVGEGIFLCRHALHATCTLFEDQKEDMLKNGLTNLAVAYNLLLQMTRFGEVLCRDEANLKNSDFGEMLDKIKPHAEIACATDDSVRQFSELNFIMLYLWPFIRAMIQNSRQGGSGGGQQQSQGQQQNWDNKQGGSNSQQQSQNQQQNGSGNAGQQGSRGGQQPNQQGQQSGAGASGGQLTPEQVKQILEQMQKGAQNAGQTQAPANKRSSQEAIDRRQAERSGKKAEQKQSSEKSKQKQNSSQSSAEAIYAALKAISQEIAQNKAEQKMEAAASKKLEQDVQAIFATDANSPHNGVPLRVERNLRVSEGDRNTYEKNMQDLRPISKRLQRQIEDALRDLRDGYVQRHRVNGRMLMVNDTYRPDGKCFASKKLPQDLPDMAISVLIDLSGSMSGDRIRTSMKAAMLLYDFATGINIPISIAGHHSPSGKEVEYVVYTDFEKVGSKDRYRLSQMSAEGNNRDGMALKICSDLLEKRPEEVKLLIIISDGRPNHWNYGGAEAKKDIQGIVRACRRKGIEVIAAGIGNDRKQIQEIYENEYLDISDLSKLPKIMTNIVKKRVLRSAL